MPKYVILGATGSTGNAVVRHLQANAPEGLKISMLVRSKAKLESQQPHTVSDPNITVIEGNLSDTSAFQRLLVGADAIINCIGENVSKPGQRVIQDSADAIIAALTDLKTEQGSQYKRPTVIVLSSSSLNKALSADQPALAYGLLHFALYYTYHDLELAQGLYERSASEGLLEYIFAQPGGIMDPEGSEETGHSLDVNKCSQSISYADLGAAMCELAARRDEFNGKAVGVSATGAVKSTWQNQAGCLLQGIKGRIFG